MNSKDIVVSARAIQGAFKRLLPAGGFEAAVDPATAVRTALDKLAADPQNAQKVAELRAGVALLEQKTHLPEVMTTVENEAASLLQSFLAEEAERAKTLTPQPAGGFEAKFDNHDPGWASVFLAWWRGLKKHAWQPPPAQAETIPNQLRVGILGDWGTGMYAAPYCAGALAVDPRGFGLLLHLGDVYYAGTAKEVAERFHYYWPHVSGAVSRALNSNHEMYSGGHAYFDQTLSAFEQSSSCFAMKNDHWLLLGLDSAYAEHDLAHDQAKWAENHVAAAGNRKVVLFSHHQPISKLEKQGEKITTKLKGLLEAKRIFAWYWGHEHRCVLYDKHPQWGFYGRCIGHSGFPYFRDDLGAEQIAAPPEGYQWFEYAGTDAFPATSILDGPNPYVVGQAERYGVQGYATLEFDGPIMREFIHDPTGKVVYASP
jgi:hypothetical protein